MLNYFTKTNLPGLWNGILSFVCCGVTSSGLCAGFLVGCKTGAPKFNNHSGKVILSLKARLQRRFLSLQLNAIFVTLKLQLQHRTCKLYISAIFSTICRRDIAGVSSMLETCCNFSATKIASSCRDKNRLSKRAFKP